MLAQRLRHRITVQSQVHSQDSTTGENSVEWEDWIPEEPAEVVPSSGREFREAGTKRGQTSGRITIRKPEALIDTSMRIIWQGREYQIEAVLPDPSDRRWLTILYTQGVNDGE